MDLNSGEMSIIGELIREVSLGNDLQSIKKIRELTSCGLAEARDFFRTYYSKEEQISKLKEENRLKEERLFELQREVAHYFNQDTRALKRLIESQKTIDFLKSIVFQYDEYKTESLNKSIIAHLATGEEK